MDIIYKKSKFNFLIKTIIPNKHIRGKIRNFIEIINSKKISKELIFNRRNDIRKNKYI